jgi:hypothetical protein
VAPDRDHEVAVAASRPSLSPVAIESLRDVRDPASPPFDLGRERVDDPDAAAELLSRDLVVLDAIAEPPRHGVEPGHPRRNPHLALFDIGAGRRVLEADLELAALIASPQPLTRRHLAEPPRRGYPLLVIRLAHRMPRADTKDATGGKEIGDHLVGRRQATRLIWFRSPRACKRAGRAGFWRACRLAFAPTLDCRRVLEVGAPGGSQVSAPGAAVTADSDEVASPQSRRGNPVLVGVHHTRRAPIRDPPKHLRLRLVQRSRV